MARFQTFKSFQSFQRFNLGIRIKSKALHLARIIHDRAGSRHSPSGTNAKQLRLEAATHGASCTITSVKVEHCARDRQYDEAVALLRSFLQGHTSIDTVSWVFLLE
jgi:hypothetical protein